MVTYVYGWEAKRRTTDIWKLQILHDFIYKYAVLSFYLFLVSAVFRCYFICMRLNIQLTIYYFFFYISVTNWLKGWRLKEFLCKNFMNGRKIVYAQYAFKYNERIETMYYIYIPWPIVVVVDKLDGNIIFERIFWYVNYIFVVDKFGTIFLNCVRCRSDVSYYRFMNK